jgi:isopentenyl-diphosphate delta-isomerase
MNKKLILVDHQDRPVGEIGKLEAHLGMGQRHRAFTAILRNDKDEVLLTKRSLKKPLWPTFWDLSFSSHPWVGESIEQACKRRAQEELGIKVSGFKRLFNYDYQVSWSDLFSECELNHILLADFSGTVVNNPEEISDWQWVKWGKCIAEKRNPDFFAPWVTKALPQLRGSFYD